MLAQHTAVGCLRVVEGCGGLLNLSRECCRVPTGVGCAPPVSTPTHLLGAGKVVNTSIWTGACHNGSLWQFEKHPWFRGRRGRAALVALGLGHPLHPLWAATPIHGNVGPPGGGHNRSDPHWTPVCGLPSRSAAQSYAQPQRHPRGRHMHRAQRGVHRANVFTNPSLHFACIVRVPGTRWPQG